MHWMYVCTDVGKHAWTYVGKHTWLCVYVYMFVCMCVHMYLADMHYSVYTCVCM